MNSLTYHSWLFLNKNFIYEFLFACLKKNEIKNNKFVVTLIKNNFYFILINILNFANTF